MRVYGSVARGQATAGSDLDILVEWEPDCSMLDVVGLKQDLEICSERPWTLAPNAVSTGSYGTS